MEKRYTHKCVGTCSQSIEIIYDDETNKIIDINVVGGCNGNLKGIKALVQGMDIGECISRLKGIQCRNRPTSCPDQLAVALEELKKN